LLQLEDAYVARRVAQRLGEWSPPALSPEERAALMEEREKTLAEIAELRAKLPGQSASSAGASTS
jgi:hypothetical protein